MYVHPPFNLVIVDVLATAAAFFGTTVLQASLKRTVSNHLSLLSRAQCPLVSITLFTKGVHFVVSIANVYSVQISLLHQSTGQVIRPFFRSFSLVFAIYYAKNNLLYHNHRCVKVDKTPRLGSSICLVLS